MDWTTVLTALIVSTAPTIVALAAWRQVKATKAQIHDLHLEVNSRLSELVESTRMAATARGELKGAADERDRNAP